ncbi:MAG: hypothetical protein LBF61_00875 [Azoarcus sp.]|jgi:hypothetical protein|nr:hypothetical protein [Azoarcus sp.]
MAKRYVRLAPESVQVGDHVVSHDWSEIDLSVADAAQAEGDARLDVSINPPADLPQTGEAVIALPDYKNIEADNLISVSGGTWTADRSGFISVSANLSMSGNSQIDVLVDDVVVYRHFDYYSSGSGWVYATIVPMAAGQTLRITVISGSGSISARFIPLVSA